MGHVIRFEKMITLERVPIQWIPKFELFTNDLPNFPLVYVHHYANEKRIFGFPISASFIKFEEGTCVPEIRFLSNVDLENDVTSKKIVEEELSERFGITNQVKVNDIMDACKGDTVYEDFFKKIWEKVIKPDHGNSIPFGRYYEKFFSIFRFNAAWNTAGRGGRQQELRIVYWFLREYGSRVKIEVERYDFYQFFLLPTFDEVKSEQLSDFPKFKKLFKVIKKIWNLEFTCENELLGKKIKSMERTWPKQRDGFVTYLNDKYVRDGTLSPEEAHDLGLLVDMFNRNPQRTIGFIWSVMSINELDYDSWSKDFLDQFYLKYFESNKKTIGVYPKVVACFLQQGFGNKYAIPMDDWILTFAKHPFGLDGVKLRPDSTKKDQRLFTHKMFFEKFDNRAKLERLIWLVAQSKKVNMDPVFDMMWCIRFGTTGDDSVLRQQNPISCYQCNLRKQCKGYATIEDDFVWIKEGSIEETDRSEASRNNCGFICATSSKVPKKIERFETSKSSKNWLYIDEFSGLRMKPEYTTSLTGKHKVKDLMEDLERHIFSSS
ncbi:MAG: hypothetical protein IIA83_08590 [Thaumarchaeota archaeon]|nr:hypothetical protein [Nitrososphaerota archaeon]